MTVPPDPGARRRAEARAVARRLHPDVGGDPEAYLAAMAELDARPAADRTAAPTRGDRTPAARLRRAARRRVRGAVRGARARLPRRLPGSRRWARL